MFWRHVVAASEAAEQAGSEQYHDDHMSAIFKEGFSFSGYERDLLVQQVADGYLDVSGVSGVDSISDGRGSVFADFDNDGDADIFLTAVQREAHYLFRNNVGQRSRFVRVALEGTRCGRDAFGAVVRVKTSTGIQTRLKAGGAGFLSQHDGRLLFGLGEDDRAEWVEIAWPGGERQRVDSVRAGSSLRFVEGTPEPQGVRETAFRLIDPLDEREALLAGLGLRVGEPFPTIEFVDAGGKPSRLADLLRPGRKTLLNLWATWCVPCALEVPELQRRYRSLQRAGVDLVGLSVDLETVEEVPSYLADRGVEYPVYTTTGEAMQKLYPRGEATVPLTVLLDDRGQVLEVYSGWNERSEQALQELAGG
ncbi:MAG: redoxin domain-containing protein [bacterium]|nr:redoxin domain-containing protein [bacterium]